MATTGSSGRGRPEERRRLVDGALEYATVHGLATMSLRPLAASLGTSDRMLIYYFGSRNGVIRSVLDQLTTDLRVLLAQTVPDHPLPARELLEHVWAVVRAPELRPSLALYLEVDVLAARGEDAFIAAADAATVAWLEWLAGQLDAPEDIVPTIAAGLMTIIDGLLLQAAAHPSVPVERAHQWLAGLVGESGAPGASRPPSVASTVE